MAFRGEQSAGESSLEELTKAIIEDVQRLPGNDVCCDCGSAGILARAVSERVVRTPSTYSQPEWFPPPSAVTRAVRSICDIPPTPHRLILPRPHLPKCPLSWKAQLDQHYGREVRHPGFESPARSSQSGPLHARSPASLIFSFLV